MANHMGVIACLLVAAALLHGAMAADTYVVLDNLGWSVPTTGNEGPYRTWVTGKDFETGDTLVFNFNNGRHDVAEVTKAGYDSCNGTSPLLSQTTGPANITLRTSGEHYYICTIPGHCLAGQKLAINVKTSTDTPPTPASPRGSSPPSSAPSITARGFFSVLLSTAIAFLY
ncbi:hypothetical protein IFM89_008307 [Coptis chinensis]|uniref:Phytocyanin domain-containing protein n=1 Tax=Coptis chinensis TaxID=261450 RepID=A0A835I6L7_9MAGN|nr:hypothetical protein IFM89_008307 [Coptis chinensis]